MPLAKAVGPCAFTGCDPNFMSFGLHAVSAIVVPAPPKWLVEVQFGVGRAFDVLVSPPWPVLKSIPINPMGRS